MFSIDTDACSKLYSLGAFMTSIGLLEIPFALAGAALFAVCFYFIVDLETERFGYFILMLIAYSLFNVALGQLIGAFFNLRTSAQEVCELL